MSNPREEEEVEQLLRAAQDDVILKLSLNSHMARAASSSYGGIDPDLDRRYQALRKSEEVLLKQKPKSSSSTAAAASDDRVDDDDLFARFAALKKSIPSYNNGESKSNVPVNEILREEESDDDDEVEKVIQWAVDAARLDPSSSTTSDDDDDDDDETDGDDGDGVDAEKSQCKKKK